MAKYGAKPAVPKPGWLDEFAKTCQPCNGTGQTCTGCKKPEGKCRCKVKAFITCAACKGAGLANLDELQRLVREREAKK